MQQRVRIPLEDGGELFLLPAYLGGNVLPVRLSPRPSKAPVYELYVGHGWVSTTLSAGELGDLLDGDEDVDDDDAEESSSSSELEDQEQHELGIRIAKFFEAMGEEARGSFAQLDDLELVTISHVVRDKLDALRGMNAAADELELESKLAAEDARDAEDSTAIAPAAWDKGPRNMLNDGETCAHGVALSMACDECAAEGYGGEPVRVDNGEGEE